MDVFKINDDDDTEIESGRQILAAFGGQRVGFGGCAPPHEGWVLGAP